MNKEQQFEYLLRIADNVLIHGQRVELPNGDYATTIAKQFFFAQFYELFLEKLKSSTDEFLRGFAEKSIKEVRYHVQHASAWVVRMGDGTEESKQRIQTAIDALWEYTPEFFIEDDLDKTAAESGYGVSLVAVKEPWMKAIKETLTEATLQIPTEGWGHKGGKQGKHTEHLGYILAEMQFLQRAYPGAKW